MLARLFAMILLRVALQIETQEIPRWITVNTAELGDTVSLDCAALPDDSVRIYWYKQSLGYVPQTVAAKTYEKMTFNPPFHLRFTVGSDFNLTIRNVTKGDEANYFCQQGVLNSWNKGTFLSVKDPNERRFVSQTVVQQSVSASAQLGDPVALQCSITSQRTDHSNQCQGEPSVYWFRSGPSHPAAIYMNGNRSGECQNSSGPPSAPQSCVYTLPKNNVDSSDSGTYYCALAACGEVVFGNGTTLDITELGKNDVTVVLGILLACCLVVIIILFLTRNKKQVCEHCKGTQSASYHVDHDSVIQEQDGETDSLNYAALKFSARKTRGMKKNSARTEESVYSAAVVQQPVSASAQLGDPVALQCSITSQRTDHSNQCQGEPSVYWFRSGPSHPAAIYMNGNRSGECQNSSGPPSAPQSCVYTLPKNNVDSSDAGTYYCALAACGEVVFGNGTKLDVFRNGTNKTEPNRHLVTGVLGILLACRLVMIIILFLTRNKKHVCEHCKGTLRASYQHDSVIQEQQDRETDLENYAALEISGRKTKAGKKNIERTQESLYSAVRETCH
ncbi:unnamed protein product [Arctogadus glacialis]